MDDSYACPNCGAEVRVGSAACPECGSDEETGWSEDTDYDGLDLPESLQEYSEFQNRKKKSQIISGIIAAGLLLLFIFGYIF